MWLFTKHGFFSVTQTRNGRLQIRARVREHLEQLRQAFPQIRRTRIITTPDADYRFRIVTTREKWTRVAQALTEEIDYGNFKNEAAALHGHKNPYVNALHTIWSVMYRLQPQNPRTLMELFNETP